jgi:uncharacterized protein (DUF58 family)
MKQHAHLRTTEDFRALQLRARNDAHTLLCGRSLSRRQGEGYDLRELREYQPGDDIRTINWTITAKLGKPYVKEFHAERELSVCLAALGDGSLYFGSGAGKQRKLAEIALLLGYSALHHGDLLVPIGYLGNQTLHHPPTRLHHTLETFAWHLYSASLLHTTLDTQEAIHDLLRHLTRRSLIILLGDFLWPCDLSVLAQQHEVVLLLIRDHAEEHPLKRSETLFESPRDGSRLATALGRHALQHYQACLQAHDETLRTQANRHRMRMAKLYTDEPAIPKLRTVFGV